MLWKYTSINIQIQHRVTKEETDLRLKKKKLNRNHVLAKVTRTMKTNKVLHISDYIEEIQKELIEPRHQLERQIEREIANQLGRKETAARVRFRERQDKIGR